VEKLGTLTPGPSPASGRGEVKAIGRGEFDAIDRVKIRA
jgi:hypothetical protein